MPALMASIYLTLLPVIGKRGTGTLGRCCEDLPHFTPHPPPRASTKPVSYIGACGSIDGPHSGSGILNKSSSGGGRKLGRRAFITETWIFSLPYPGLRMTEERCVLRTFDWKDCVLLKCTQRIV
ncbi:hypothetical protein EJ06DRAFT_534854 [Trichodelitschia bisporula]|uniref:Secreted protein n=1 Tax=Trichodelitschia bisporula TaxID=703511 RepID=A0A6G1HHW6_9PEZI|nr:hypothetical protein EJ06DRAFT_534854 [Trichodelitschia bisporula]